MPALGVQQRDHLIEHICVLLHGLGFGLGVGTQLNPGHVGDDFGRQLLGRGHHIGHAGLNGTARHAVELGGGRGLNKAGACRFTDGAQAQRAIGPHARENHTNAVLLAIVRQRLEKGVNRQAQTPRLRGLLQMQHALLNRQVPPRGNHIDLVGHQRHPVADLFHRHVRAPAQELHQHALPVRVQVLNHHERHAAIDRHMG